MGLLPITIARVLYAILAGAVTFLIVWIIGAAVIDKHADIGGKLEDWAPLLGLLVGLLTYCVVPTPKSPVA